MNLSNIFKRDPKKVEALVIAKQSAAAYEFAVRKGGNAVSGRTKTAYKKRNKIKGKPQAVVARTEPREKKAVYNAGKLGLSAVSQVIKETFGIIPNRRSRKETARLFGSPFKKIYNGEGPVRDKGYMRKPSKYAKRRVQ